MIHLKMICYLKYYSVKTGGLIIRNTYFPTVNFCQKEIWGNL